MAKHSCPDTKRLIKVLVKQGCIVKDKGQQMQIYAPDGVSILTVHMGGKGRSYHPMRRWALKHDLEIK